MRWRFITSSAMFWFSIVIMFVSAFLADLDLIPKRVPEVSALTAIFGVCWMFIEFLPQNSRLRRASRR